MFGLLSLHRARSTLLIGLVGVFAASTGYAQTSTGAILDNLGTINFDSNSKFAIGDTVSIHNLTGPRERCLKYDKQTDVKQDTPGAVSSKLGLYLVNTYEDFEREFKFSFSLQASMGAKFGDIFGGDASTTHSAKFDQFLTKEKHNLLVILEASADHGRQFISDFSIDDKFQPLLNGRDKSPFIEKCGTHFIRGIAKKSSLRIVFNVSSLNETTKTMVAYKFSESASAKAGFQGISQEYKSTLSADLATTLKLAAKFGKITFEIQGAGGSGIASLGKALKGARLTDYTDVKNILDAFADASSDFTATNAAPDRFIIVPHPQLIATDIKFDQKRYDQMGKIYKALLRVGDQLSIYESYKNKNRVLWEKYFQVYTQKFTDLRSGLLSKYADCRDRGKCDDDIPQRVDGITLDDVVYGGEIVATCPLGNMDNSRLNPSTNRQTEYLSSVILAWSGKIRFLDDIDINGIEVYRISQDLEMIRLPFSAERQLRLRDEGNGKTSAYITVHRQNADPELALKAGDIDLNYLDGVRVEAARSIYLMRFRTTAGVSVDDVLGYPNMKGCKLLEEHL